MRMGEIEHRLTAIEENIDWLKKITWALFSGIIINIGVSLFKV